MNSINPQFGMVYARQTEDQAKTLVNDLHQKSLAKRVKVVSLDAAVAAGVPLTNGFKDKYTVITDGDVPVFDALQGVYQEGQDKMTEAQTSRTGANDAFAQQFFKVKQRMVEFLNGEL